LSDYSGSFVFTLCGGGESGICSLYKHFMLHAPEMTQVRTPPSGGSYVGTEELQHPVLSRYFSFLGRYITSV